MDYEPVGFFLYILMLWIMQLYSTVKKIISNDYESSQQ
jgi:hypothetical protein